MEVIDVGGQKQPDWGPAYGHNIVSTRTEYFRTVSWSYHRGIARAPFTDHSNEKLQTTPPSPSTTSALQPSLSTTSINNDETNEYRKGNDKKTRTTRLPEIRSKNQGSMLRLQAMPLLRRDAPPSPVRPPCPAQQVYSDREKQKGAKVSASRTALLSWIILRGPSSEENVLETSIVECPRRFSPASQRPTKNTSDKNKNDGKTFYQQHHRLTDSPPSDPAFLCMALTTSGRAIASFHSRADPC